MLANLLFPEITQIPEDILKKYPKRKPWMIVTRIGPSPTWFLHIWTIYSAMLDKIVAYQNKWVCFLRIEDTDQKREILWASQKFVDIFKIFWIEFDEWPIGENYKDIWNYWPYTQSKREDIYKIFIKDLLSKWYAYPCFLTEEEINATRKIQESLKIPTWIYKEYSPWRYASIDEVQKALDEKKEFVIRFKSNGELTRKTEIQDLIKWKVSTQENFLDIVICKSNGLPTYHFAHLIDDHLMGTTHVIRSDEWFASVPLHKELFECMRWEMPSYAHYWPLVKIDGESRRKISKSKDVEADVEFYFSQGYFIEAILDFLSNIINSSFEDWRKENGETSFLDFDFKLEKINTAWALVDIQKLNWVNSNWMKKMPLETLYTQLSQYLEIYEHEFYTTVFMKFSKEYNLSILTELKTRLIIFKDYIALTSFFYNEFEIQKNILDLLMNAKMKIENMEMVKKSLLLWLEIITNHTGEFSSIDEIKNIFVEEIKKAEMKNGQVLWPIRVALSGEEFSPWALELIFLLKKEKSTQRIKNILKSI